MTQLREFSEIQIFQKSKKNILATFSMLFQAYFNRATTPHRILDLSHLTVLKKRG
jgi:hypothetical protein